MKATWIGDMFDQGATMVEVETLPFITPTLWPLTCAQCPVDLPGLKTEEDNSPELLLVMERSFPNYHWFLSGISAGEESLFQHSDMTVTSLPTMRDFTPNTTVPCHLLLRTPNHWTFLPPSAMHHCLSPGGMTHQRLSSLPIPLLDLQTHPIHKMSFCFQWELFNLSHFVVKMGSVLSFDKWKKNNHSRCSLDKQQRGSISTNLTNKLA